jgi:hypothetical protein
LRLGRPGGNRSLAFSFRAGFGKTGSLASAICPGGDRDQSPQRDHRPKLHSERDALLLRMKGSVAQRTAVEALRNVDPA